MARTASGAALGLSKTRLKSPLFGAVLCLDRGVGVGEEGKSRLFLDLRYAAAKLPAELLSVFVGDPESDGFQFRGLAVGDPLAGRAVARAQQHL